MYCAFCGTKLSDDSLFCSKCGASVKDGLPEGENRHTPDSTRIDEQPETEKTTPEVVPVERESTSDKGTANSPGTPKWSAARIVITSIAALVACAVVVFVVIPFASGVRPSLDAYSWEQLSAISSEIEHAGSEAAAIEIAKKYNLCDSDGKILTGNNAGKRIKLTDGTGATVRIVGFLHDKKTHEVGKAGITFAFAAPVERRVMNSDESNSGGWKNSDMRDWLNSEFFAKLPEDMQNAIIPVDKLTNNEGHAENASSVSETSDMLWLFSHRELVGQSNQYSNEGHPAYDTVLNAEGEQYKLYRDHQVGSANGDNDLLYKGRAWWQRSPCPGRNDCFHYVNGGPTFMFPDDLEEYTYANGNELGAVPGFCV